MLREKSRGLVDELQGLARAGKVSEYRFSANKKDAKPQKDRPGNGELPRLCAACEAYDMDEIEAVMREIESYEYMSDGGLAGWLSGNIARLNCAQIIEKFSRVSAERK